MLQDGRKKILNELFGFLFKSIVKTFLISIVRKAV